MSASLLKVTVCSPWKGAPGCSGMLEGMKEFWDWGLRCGKKAKPSLQAQSDIAALWQWDGLCPLRILTDQLHAARVPQTLTMPPSLSALGSHLPKPQECIADWLRLWVQVDEFSACQRARSGVENNSPINPTIKPAD